MATIDASIPLQYRQPQFESPINKLAQVMQLQGMQDQQMERQAARDEQNRLKTLLASPTDDLGAALTRGGFLPQAQAYAKTQAEIAKAKREEQESLQRGQKFDFERTQGIIKEMNRAVSSLLNDPDSTPELARQEAMRIGKLFKMPDDQIGAIIQAIPEDPVQFRKYLAKENNQGIDAEKRLTLYAPKPVEVSTNGVKFFIDNNALSPTYGQRTSAPEVKMEMSPAQVQEAADRKASREQAERHFQTNQSNAGTVYDPERGLAVNVRAGLARPVATIDGKPIGAKDKPMTEGQAKAALFGARAEQSDKILADLAAKGTVKSVPGSNAPFVGGAITAISSEQQQQLSQAKRDFINAVLRRESGAVISPEEFENAEKQYFPQIGDKPETVKQKAANRATAIRGIQVEIPNSRAVIDKITTPSKSGGWGIQKVD